MEENQKRPSRARQILESLVENKDSELLDEFYKYLEISPAPVIQVLLGSRALQEATRSTVGQFTARRDQPHFQGDETHAHCKVGRGMEVAWTVSGLRRHPNKFPAQIPYAAKAAIGKVLNIDPNPLEAFWVKENGRTRLILLEAHNKLL